MTIPESDFTPAVERALNTVGSPVRVERINSGDIVYERKGSSRNCFRGAPAGTGDLVGWVIGPGTRLEVETKAKKGKARKAQIARSVVAAKHGWIYVSVRAGDDLEQSVAAAVEVVHAAIAHLVGVRDLKPANVLQFKRPRAARSLCDATKTTGVSPARSL